MATGAIVSITSRNWRQRGYAGSLRPSDNITLGRSASLLFAPIERRFPFIRVTTRQAATLMDKRIVVVVDEWPSDSQYPLGHYRHTIGKIGELKVETEVLLLEYDVNTAPFTQARALLLLLLLRHACTMRLNSSALPVAVAAAQMQPCSCKHRLHLLALTHQRNGVAT
jgi:Dis3-like cold-shock domain 2 (CSD2)